MPSLLSRLRKRTSSTVTSTGTSSSDAPTLITPPAPPLTTLPSSSPPVISAVDRKILANPNDLFDDDEEEEEQPRKVPTGLLPSPRKSSFGAMRKPTVQEDEDEESFLPGTSGSVHGYSDPKSNRRFLNRLSDIASPGEWSTFGRQKEYSSPTLGDFGERITKPRGSTEAAARPPSTSPTAPPTLSHSSSGPSQKSKKDISPSDTISSKAKSSPKTPIRPQSASSSFFNSPSPPLRSMGAESPMTFGYPTPPETRTAGFNFGPFTALDEFGRFDSPLPSEGPSSPLPLPPPMRSHNDTYPPYGRSSDGWKQGANYSKGTSSTFPQVFGKSSHRRVSSSRPKAQQIFKFERDIAIDSSDASNAEESYATASSRRSSPASTTSNRNRQNLREAVGYPHQDKGDTHGSDGLVSKGIDLFKFERGGNEASGGDRARVMPHAASHVNPSSLHSPFPSSQSLGRIIVQGGVVDANLSGRPSDPHHARFISTSSDEEVKAGETAVKASDRPENMTDSSSRGKDPVVDTPSDPTSSSSPALLQIPPSLSFTSPTPETSPFRPSVSSPSANTPSDSKNSTLPIPPSALKTPSRTPSDKSKGKRKADDSEITPPDHKKEAQRTTFAPTEPRSVRVSDSSHAPSSYHSYQNKRARISSNPPLTVPSESGPGSQQGHNYGSWSSRGSSRSNHPQPPRTPSRAASTRSQSQHQNQQHQSGHRASSDRRSISGMSIPISALVSPHAPSVSRSTKFHMQDPRKPPRKQETSWALRFNSVEEPGSPIHAWFFFIGFVVFPLWWVASFWRTPQTRHVGGSDTEKAVTLDDPQVEHDAKAWRFRCRIMALVSFFTYIPFIVLVAIFA